jgi:threonine/homoserine/homoserine lactone efflux protein
VPTLIDINSIGPREYGILLVTTFVVLLVVLVPYMMLASRARTLLKQPRALRALNRVAASILAGTAAFIATRAA